jgi:intein/homing endonuclease
MARRFTPQQLEFLKRECQSEEEYRFLLEADDPVLWSETYLMDPDEGKARFECKEQFKPVLRDAKLNRALRVGRQQGKCCSYNTTIQLADGSIPTADELYKIVGEDGEFEILSTSNTTYQHIKTKAYIEDNGIKDTITVQTTSGFETTNTDNHPYLVWPNTSSTPVWLKGTDLVPGMRIAVTRSLTRCAVSSDNSSIGEYEAELLGYIVGDGGTSQRSVRFTTSDTEIAERINYILDILNTNTKLSKCKGKYEYLFTVNDINKHTHGQKWIDTFVKNHKLSGTLSKNKHVPSSLFTSSNEAISSFLSGYWSTDGWISEHPIRKSVQIGVCSASKHLISGTRTLLLRLGIQSRVRYKKVKYKGGYRDAWQLTISDSRSIEQFKTSVYLYHSKKQEKLANCSIKHNNSNTDTIPSGVWNYIDEKLKTSGRSAASVIQSSTGRFRRNYSPNRTKLQNQTDSFNDEYLKNISTSDIFWDKVKTVDNTGRMQSYAISVKETENLITDNFVTHNTVHMCVDILHLAATKSNATVLIFVPEKKNMNRMLEIMKNLLTGSPIESSFSMGRKMRVKTKLEPQYDYEISSTSGSVVRFFFMAQKPDKARGQSVTHIYIDEAEYIPEKAWPVITGMFKKDPNIPTFASSTPSGLEGTWFREFCDACSKPGSVRGSEYHIPSTVEKNWPEIEIRLREVIFDEVTWKLEVLAEWAEARGAVYKKELIDSAIERSQLMGFYLDTTEIRNTLDYKHSKKFLGVDWNNPQNGTRLIELALINDKLWLTRHEKIAYEKYTQTVAVDRIIELHRHAKYEFISVDSGYGEVQIELLHQKMNKSDGDIGHILNIIDAGKKEKMVIEYENPGGGVRKTKVDVRAKTKLVGLVTKYLEFMLTIPKDEAEVKDGIVKELRNFKRKESLREGGFVYSENTHSLSALQMCIHGADKYLSNFRGIENVAYDNMESNELRNIVKTSKAMSTERVATIISNRSSVAGRNRTSGLGNGYTRRTIL